MEIIRNGFKNALFFFLREGREKVGVLPGLMKTNKVPLTVCTDK